MRPRLSAQRGATEAPLAIIARERTATTVLSTGPVVGYLVAHTHSVLDASGLIVGSHVRVLAHPVEFGDNEPENGPTVAEPPSLAGHWMFFPEIAQRPTTREASVVWYQTDVATDTFAGVWAAHSFAPSTGATWSAPFHVAPDSSVAIAQRNLGDYLGLTAVAPFFDIGSSNGPYPAGFYVAYGDGSFKVLVSGFELP